jgi:sortase (surface protein transpeptidase)
MNHLIPVIGYFLFTFCYLIQLLMSINKDNMYIICGTILLSFGYFELFLKYYNEMKEHKEVKGHNEKKDYKEKKHNKQKKWNKTGNLILFIYIFMSYLLPINRHKHLTDVFSLIAHLIIITNLDSNFSNILFILYYISYAMATLEEDSILNKIKLLASLFLIYYNGQHAYEHYILKKTDKKH